MSNYERLHDWKRQEVLCVTMQAVQIAMDRKDREREQLSTLLSNLYPNTISQDQMAKGFTRLLQFTEVCAHYKSAAYCII